MAGIMNFIAVLVYGLMQIWRLRGGRIFKGCHVMAILIGAQYRNNGYAFQEKTVFQLIEIILIGALDPLKK